MVRLGSVLSRVPVIKFRKGVSGQSSGASGSAGGAQTPQRSSASPQGQPTAGMSTRATIHDFELPARYRRAPLSQEEIDHINGGGIV